VSLLQDAVEESLRSHRLTLSQQYLIAQVLREGEVTAQELISLGYLMEMLNEGIVKLDQDPKIVPQDRKR
jgi:hypothetical protein